MSNDLGDLGGLAIVRTSAMVEKSSPFRLRRRILTMTLLGALSGGLVSAPRVISEHYSPGSIGPWLIFPIGFLSFWALLACLACFLVAARKSVRPAALQVLCLSAAFLAVGWGVWFFQSEARSLALEAFVERSRPLIEAVKQYQLDHGAPPQRLALLVPDYLEAVPGTGLSAHPEHAYKTFAVEDKPDAQIAGWQLSVLVPRGFRDYDYLVFRSTGAYAEFTANGLIAKQLDGWAFVACCRPKWI